MCAVRRWCRCGVGGAVCSKGAGVGWKPGVRVSVACARVEVTGGDARARFYGVSQRNQNVVKITILEPSRRVVSRRFDAPRTSATELETWRNMFRELPHPSSRVRGWRRLSRLRRRQDSRRDALDRAGGGSGGREPPRRARTTERARPRTKTSRLGMPRPPPTRPRLARGTGPRSCAREPRKRPPGMTCDICPPRSSPRARGTPSAA